MMAEIDRKVAVVARVCHALTDDKSTEASRILNDDYPFAPEPPTKRHYGPLEATRVFIRDGFIDRYSGDRLIYPPVLRVVSVELPEDFPYHPNWKTDATHAAYWEVAPTIDHLVPVTRGGADDESNWYTTSMAHNFAKMNWTLKDLGWTLHPAGDYRDWDGLLTWFLGYEIAVGISQKRHYCADGSFWSLTWQLVPAIDAGNQYNQNGASKAAALHLRRCCQSAY